MLEPTFRCLTNPAGDRVDVFLVLGCRGYSWVGFASYLLSGEFLMEGLFPVAHGGIETTIVAK